MGELQYATLPDRRSLKRQWHKVHGPREGKPLRVWPLGSKVLALWVHFDTSINKVRPCMGGNECSFCANAQGRRFMGYVAAVRADTRELCVAELTEGAYRKLEDLGLLPGKLRGHELKLFRLKPHKNAPVMVEAKKLRDPENLPAEFDPLPHLQRLWGWTDANEDALRERKKERPQDMKSLLGSIGGMGGQS